MRRRRRAFSMFAAASALGCIFIAGLWARCYWRADQINGATSDHGLCIASANGVLAIMGGPIYKGPEAMEVPPQWSYGSYPAQPGDMVKCQVPLAKYHR